MSGPEDLRECTTSQNNSTVIPPLSLSSGVFFFAEKTGTWVIFGKKSNTSPSGDVEQQTWKEQRVLCLVRDELVLAALTRWWPTVAPHSGHREPIMTSLTYPPPPIWSHLSKFHTTCSLIRANALWTARSSQSSASADTGSFTFTDCWQHKEHFDFHPGLRRLTDEICPHHKVWYHLNLSAVFMAVEYHVYTNPAASPFPPNCNLIIHKPRCQQFSLERLFTKRNRICGLFCTTETCVCVCVAASSFLRSFYSSF